MCMSKNKTSSKANMALLDKEKKRQHRAFLLYAMCAAKKRSMRLISKAVGVSTPTIADWKKKFKWADRMISAGPAHDAIAQKMYQDLYFEEIGMREIAMVEKRIVNVQSVVATTTKEIGSAASAAVKDSLDQINSDKASTVFDDEMKARHLDLVDRSIQYISDALLSGEVKVTLKDLPAMLELRDDINGKAKEGDKKGSIIIETIRVKDAKASGGDLIDAMLSDSQELVAIFTALSMKGKHPSNHETEDLKDQA